MDARKARVLYLAVADGRGHLMRAHLLRGLLGGAGLGVDIVTTSHAGQAFLAGLGTPAALLPGGFQLLFDDRHHMLAGRTERRLAAYLASPRGLARDAARLVRLGTGARFVVNDSLHPAALWLAAAPRLARAPRVVNVHGDNLWRAAIQNFEGRLPDWLSGGFGRLLQAIDARAFGGIVHSLAAADRPGRRDGPNRFRLPPLVAAPRRTRAAVRSALGLSERDRLAAIYLNPHFRDPRLAARLETALAQRGVRFYGVSEPWAGRPGWRAFDPDFGDVVAASDSIGVGRGRRRAGAGPTGGGAAARAARRTTRTGPEPGAGRLIGDGRARGRRRRSHGALPGDRRAHHRGASGAGAPRRARARPAAVDRCFPVTGDTEQGGATWNQK